MTKFTSIDTRNGISIQTVDKTMSITAAQLVKLNTNLKIKTALNTTFGQTILDLYVHINRDKTICIVTGEPISVWPENQPEEVI